jgi:hypothetical protein
MPFGSDVGYMADQYEALRKQALAATSASRGGHGLALFLVRGMPGWLAALALVVPSPERPRRPSESGSLLCRPSLLGSEQSNFTSLLADMVLALRPEATT